MIDRSPFDAERDGELGELIREALTGPEPELFADRLQAVIRGLPDRGSQWDVLAGWARPGVVMAAAAAGLLLGLALWQGWRQRVGPAETSVSVALLEPMQRSVEPIIYSVLEER